MVIKQLDEGMLVHAACTDVAMLQAEEQRKMKRCFVQVLIGRLRSYYGDAEDNVD